MEDKLLPPTTFFQPMQLSDFRGYIKQAIKAELVNQCSQLHPEDQPFHPNNPGDDPHFHTVVADILDQINDDIMDKCDIALNGPQ